MPIKTRETMTEAGARYIKSLIDEYWKNEGRAANTWIERDDLPSRAGNFVVRSDLGLHLPPMRKEHNVK
jgi:hypothetical protein